MKLNGTVLRLSVAHFFVDCYSSMLGVFLPFLAVSLGLSLTQAGVLGGVLILSGSLLQPVYGYLADHFQHKIFVTLGPAAAGTFISCLGVAPNYATLLLLVFLAGIGIAAFHPQGTAVVSTASPHRPGFHLSFFIASGTTGYALGPIFISTVIETVDLSHSYLAALPAIVVTFYLLFRGPAPVRSDRRTQRGLMLRQLQEQRLPLIFLYVLVVIRSAVQLVFVAFLPLYLTGRGYSEYEASQVLGLFLFVGGMGGFLGGILSDRWGGKFIICLSMLLFVPLLLGFLVMEGTLSLILCALGGGFLLLTLPVNVRMAQKLVPEGASTVSALLMGFAWGVGGIAVPIVGVVSDQVGLHTSLTGLILCCVPGAILSLALPSRERLRGAPTTGRAPLGSPADTPSLRMSDPPAAVLQGMKHD